MFEYRNKQNVPFYIYVSDKDENEIKEGMKKEDVIGYNVDYRERLTDDYLKKWFLEFNECLKYLSGGQFSMKLEKIYRGDDLIPSYTVFGDIEGFKMIIDPTIIGGLYINEGNFEVGAHYVALVSDPIYLTFIKRDWKSDDLKIIGKNKKRASIGAPVHEVLHGFLGKGHPYGNKARRVSIMANGDILGLLPGELEYLGWPKIEPIKILDFLIKFKKKVTK